MVINLSRYKLIIVFIILLLLALLLIYGLSLKQPEENAEPEVEDTSLYGQFLPWEEVTDVFPRYAKAVVIDLETGLEFVVQRRAGQYHADVQPLTADDTAIMKNIYGGKWSWKRRAIIVKLDNGLKIAGSMHGMPHGQGAIRGNNFNGHFCIHFRDSKTHGSRKADLSHQIMVWKAADVLDKQLQDLEAEQIIKVFFTALDQGDISITEKMIYPSFDVKSLLNDVKNIKYLTVDKRRRIEDNVYEVQVRLAFENSIHEVSKKVRIKLVKTDSYLKLDSQVLKSILEN